MSTLTFAIYKTIDHEYYFRLRDDLDRILLTSRHYTSMTSCINDLYWLQVYNDYEVLEKCEGSTRRYFYYIVKPEGSVLAKSPVYVLQHSMHKDLQIIEEQISTAAVIDMTAVVRFFRPSSLSGK
jgi:uncharacterized protein YegP (UPF0339 family)